MDGAHQEENLIDQTELDSMWFASLSGRALRDCRSKFGLCKPMTQKSPNKALGPPKTRRLFISLITT